MGANPFGRPISLSDPLSQAISSSICIAGIIPSMLLVHIDGIAVLKGDKSPLV